MKSLKFLLLSVLLIVVTASTCCALVWQSVALLNDASQTYCKSARCWAASDNGFHAVYKDVNNSNRLYYRKYSLGNLTGPYDTGATHSYGTHFLCESLSGDIWITWENWNAPNGEQVYAARSTNGINWTQYPVTAYVYGPGEGGQGKLPEIQPLGTGNSPQVIALTWRPRTNNDRMYHNVWNGSAFTGNVEDWYATNYYAAVGSCRSLADGSVYRTYGVQVNGVWQIAYRRFDGSNWGPEVVVSNRTDGFSSRPDIAVNGAGQILVVWDVDNRVKAKFYNPPNGWSPELDFNWGWNAHVTAIPGRNDFYVTYALDNSVLGRRFVDGTIYPTDVVSYNINPSGYCADNEITAAADGTLYAVFECWGTGAAQQYWTVCRDFSGGADTTPPTAPVVHDDGSSTVASTYLHFWWDPAQDPESGISYYEYSIGTSPGATNVVGWTNCGGSLERYQLQLFEPGTYYVNVRATNRAGLTGPAGTSDGITINCVSSPYSFTSGAALSASSYKCENANLAKSSDGGLYLVFEDYNNDARKVIYRKWLNGSWGAAEEVTTGSPSGTYPDIVEDTSGNIHVVYGNSGARENIDLYERIKSGSTWASATAITTSGTQDWYPRLAKGTDGRIWLANNGDGTSYSVMAAYKDSTWSSFTTLGTSSRYGLPDIATGPDGTAHMVWVQGNDVKYSKNTGSGWSAPTTIYSESGANWARIAVDQAGNPAVVWRGTAIDPPGAQVCFSKWNGSSWSPRTVLGFGYHVNIACDSDGRFHVVFTENLNYSNQEVVHLAYDGTNWTQARNVSAAPSNSDLAAIETVDNDVHVVWQDNATGTLVIMHSKANGPVPTYGAISGTVRDAVGNPVAGATVSTTSGGYTTTSGSGGAYTLANVAVGTYNVVASKAYYNTTTQTGIVVTGGQTTTCDFTLAETAPGPVQSFTANGSDSVVRLSWTNPNSGNFAATVIRCSTSGYPSSPTSGDAVCDKAGSPNTPDSYVHTGLVNGLTYYYSAFARTANGTYSTVAHAQAPTIAANIAEVRLRPENALVDMSGKRVTAVFADDGCLYVQEPDGVSGIRVDGSFPNIEVGHQVSLIGGTVTTINRGGVSSERRIVGATVTKDSETKTNPSPWMMLTRSVGGRPTSLFEGVYNGIGINNIGLLVKVAGIVTSKDAGMIFIDDGAGVNNALGDGTARTGVKVLCDPSGVSQGDVVSATGIIVGDVPAGWSTNAACIKTHSAADIRVFYTSVVPGAITGTVKDSSNNALSGATVSTNTGGYSTTTNASGAYTLSNVIPGTYSVTASKTGYASQTNNGVTVTSGGTVVSNFTLSPQPGTITGTVKDTSNNAISGATVSTTSGGYSTTTNSSGAYTLSNVAAGTYSVVASKSGYNSSTNSGVVVNPGGSAVSNFTLTPQPGTITGTVKDTSNNAISGATVSTTSGGYSTTTNASGAYTLSNVTPGTYSVVASKSGYRSSTNTGVVVNPGGSAVSDFTLTASNPVEKLLNGNFEGPFSYCGWWAGNYPEHWGFTWRSNPENNAFYFDSYNYGGAYGKVCKITVYQANMEAGLIQQVSGLTPGTQYTFSAYAYQFDQGSNVWIAVDPNGGTTMPSRTVHFVNITGQWNYQSVTGTVGAGGTVSVFLWVWNQWATGDVYIDNASLMAE